MDKHVIFSIYELIFFPGIYVQMFTTVAKNFFKFLAAYFCLLVAFALRKTFNNKIIKSQISENAQQE